MGQYNYSKQGKKLLERAKLPKMGYVIIVASFITLTWVSFLITSCASIQSPTGGPKDSIPPMVLKELPKNLSKNFKSEQVSIYFNEFVKLNNEYTEISISPSMDIIPSFKVKKENLKIEFKEILQENTTYSINFGKAVVDVNESNPIKNYSYVFSTGDQIDSLSISGKVYNSLTKEKLKDVTVFVLPINQDSIFGKKKASLFNITDTAGYFKISNLKGGLYKIYALLEQGGDRIYNGQNEEIGFLEKAIKLEKDTSNLVLEVFKEYPQLFMVKDRRIETDGRLSLIFNKPVDNPVIHILDKANLEELKKVEFNLTRDTASIWLPEITFDTINVAIVDGKNALDTVTLRRNKKDTYVQNLTVSDNLIGLKIRPGTDLKIKLSAPINTVQESNITLLEDSTILKNYRLQKDTSSFRKYSIKYPWKINKQYTLKFAENTFTDIFANKSKSYTKKFELDSEENYGSMSVKYTIPDTTKTYLVQWLNEKKDVLRQDVLNKSGVLNYIRYPTGKYEIRIIYDTNSNRKWDTGSVREKRQPEKSWNFNKIITLRPNWDLEESITIPDL